MPKKIKMETNRDKVSFVVSPVFNQKFKKCVISVPYSWAKEYEDYDYLEFEVTIKPIITKVKN